jgi:hypothetical protein
MIFRQAAGPQADVVDIAVSRFQSGQRLRVGRDLAEIRIGVEAERFTGLVERAEANVARAGY